MKKVKLHGFIVILSILCIKVVPYGNDKEGMLVIKGATIMNAIRLTEEFNRNMIRLQTTDAYKVADILAKWIEHKTKIKNMV
jgi:hypothetical protein